MVDKMKNKDGNRPGKKCKNCGLDCSVVRALSVINLPESMKSEGLKAIYGDTKPVFNLENCKKV